MVYDSIYSSHCQTAIDHFVVQEAGRASFVQNLRERLQRDYEQIKVCTDTSVVSQHLQCLLDLQRYLKPLRSHKTCLCCLLRAPEKVFSCGHSICDTCVRAFGQRNSEERNSFSFSRCILCDGQNNKAEISLTPFTAGVRLLSLDGGGVRGVIPLVFLQHLEESLSGFQVPFRDFFDFVCGTSAGMWLGFEKKEERKKH
jgi:hypothetical protein